MSQPHKSFSVRRMSDECDREQIERFLAPLTTRSMFLLSNMRRSGINIFAHKPYQGEYWGVFVRDGEVVGVLAHYWNDLVMMQVTHTAAAIELATVFAQSRKRPIGGFLGEPTQVRVFLDAFQINDTRQARMNDVQGLYDLDLSKLLVPQISDENLLQEHPQSEHRQLLTGWRAHYEAEIEGGTSVQGRLEKAQEVVERSISSGEWRILLQENKPVSLCGINARLPEMVQVGAVYTPPSMRSNGYARLNVALMLQKERERGAKKAILFTGTEAAAKAYVSIGFQRIGEYQIFLLKDLI